MSSSTPNSTENFKINVSTTPNSTSSSKTSRIKLCTVENFRCGDAGVEALAKFEGKSSKYYAERELELYPLYWEKKATLFPTCEQHTKIPFFEWPGRQVICCQGRLICGSHLWFSFATWSAIMLSSAATISFSITFLHWYHAFFESVLTLLVLYNLFLTASTEPGIIPRMNIEHSNRNTKLKLGKTVWTYCKTCQIYRPPRSKHCRQCGVCVLEFDHHCPWTSNCIGVRNYKYFLRFLLFLLILISFTIYINCELLLSHTGPLLIPVVVLIIICGFGFLAVFQLFTYHIYLIRLGKTTNEHWTGRKGVPSGLFRNLKRICCSKKRRSTFTLTRLEKSPPHIFKPIPLKYPSKKSSNKKVKRNVYAQKTLNGVIIHE